MEISMPLFFTDILRNADQLVNRLLRAQVNDLSTMSLLLLMGASFLYGVVHSLGPGHGKLLITTYFVKDRHPLRNAVVLSGLVSLIHSGVSVLLALILFFILTGIRGFFQIRLQNYFITASGILILIIGLVFLILALRTRHSKQSTPSPRKSNLFLVGLSAGIVPCPAALMIMLFSLSRGITGTGIAAVISISVGMFALLSVVGILSIKTRSVMVTAFGARGFGEHASIILEYIAIGGIILIGLFMLVGTVKFL
jgi:nickel/cobalt transporter (NicO) family protein